MTATPLRHPAFIFCRGGSKGIPGKNIKMLAGKPLLAHAIDCALASNSIDSVSVSTDSADIASVAREHGAEVIMRPDELATDTASELDAWRHAISESAMADDDVFISLPATSPLRAPEDVDAAIARFGQGDCDMVFGISPSHRNPYLNMVRLDDQGHIHVVNASDAYRRQDVPDIFDITTCVYVGRVGYIRVCSSLMAGRVGAVEIPAERALDIDTPFDFHLADLLLRTPFSDTTQEVTDEG